MAIREIIFRGKRVDNGEWIYGDLLCSNGNYYIHEKGKPIVSYVSPMAAFGTVGEWTGLTDKDGRKIFEGDIVRTQEYYDRLNSAKAKRKRHIGVVEYTIYKFADGRCYNAEWRVKIDDYGEYSYGVRSQLYDCEVIGNIYDNPELLEGKE